MTGRRAAAIFAIVAAIIATVLNVWDWDGSFAAWMILLGATIILITAIPIVLGTRGR
jgi:hypothetical protein